MGIPKYMGIETEYNIYLRNTEEDGGNIINAMIEHLKGEPLGLDKQSATPIKCFLRNGGLVYKDMGAPEYCTPECPNPKSLVAFDKAGEIIIQKLAREVSVLKECEISIYKKSSDGYGNPSGCHENYSITPELFLTLVNADRNDVNVSIWSTFLLLRQLITGGGKIGSELQNMPATFQISQRSDFIVAFRNNIDLSDRPVIHCRDEPWADNNLVRRLHVIVGEPNLCEWSLFLKVGLSALMLMALEDGYFSTNNVPIFQTDTIPGLFPVLSRDIKLVQKYNVAITNSNQNEQSVTAIEMLNFYVETLADYLSTTGERGLSSEEYLIYQDVIDKARFIISKLLNQDIKDLFGICDWTTKLILAEQFLNKKSNTITNYQNDPNLELELRTFIDMGYGSINPETSLFHRLAQKGLIKRITTDEEINSAMVVAPGEGRASLRVAIASKFPDNIKMVSWNKVVLFEDGKEFTIELSTPFLYNHTILNDAVMASQTPEELGSAWTALLQEGV